MKSLPPLTFLSKNTPARTKRGVHLNSSSPCHSWWVDFQGYGDLLWRLIWTCRDHLVVLWYQSAIQYDKDQLLPDGLCWCMQGAPAYRRENIAAVQGFSPIFTSPLLTVVYWILLLHPCMLPRASLRCLSLWDSVPSFLPLGCKLPSPWHPTWAIPLHGKDAWSSAGEDGGHPVTGILALTSDTATVRGRGRHKICNGCRGTSDLTAWKFAVKENLVYSHLTKIRERPIIRVVQALAPNCL